MAKLITSDQMTVCNCAGCNKVLLGERMTQEMIAGTIRSAVEWPEPVAERVNDRPYCDKCRRHMQYANLPGRTLASKPAINGRRATAAA